MKGETVIRKMTEQLDDWFNNRYAELVDGDDELDELWENIMATVLENQLANIPGVRITPSLHECVVCGVAMPYDAWPVDETIFCAYEDCDQSVDHEGDLCPTHMEG